MGMVTICATTWRAAADWLALFLTDERGATASLAAFGYAVFAVAMAAGRFSGTAVAERLERHGAVRVGGMVGFAGGAAHGARAGAGQRVRGGRPVGAGVCLVFGGGQRRRRAPYRPADAIAAVTTIGYGGFLLDPPLIGLLADQVGLGRACSSCWCWPPASPPWPRRCAPPAPSSIAVMLRQTRRVRRP